MSHTAHHRQPASPHTLYRADTLCDALVALLNEIARALLQGLVGPAPSRPRSQLRPEGAPRKLLRQRLRDLAVSRLLHVVVRPIQPLPRCMYLHFHKHARMPHMHACGCVHTHEHHNHSDAVD